MARKSMQKQKILYICKILLEKTDERHAVTMKEILEELERYGVPAERKSVYNDLQLLSDFGLDICRTKSATTKYYIGSRKFQMPELKLLVDAVQCSKFITTKKSLELIKKLEGLCSAEDAKLLQRQVFVFNRVKAMNEKIYYNVDTLHNAVSREKQITFVYTEWTLNFGSLEKITKQPRKEGALYQVSPWALSWDDENYYLIAYDGENQMLKHYRVDKMEEIRLTEEDNEGRNAFEKFDIASYSKAVFSMFGGDMTEINLSVDNSLVGVIVDRFGKDVFVSRESASTFSVHFKAVVSPQFYGWLFGLGDKVKISAPRHVAEGYRAYLQNVMRLYSEEEKI